MLLVAFLFQGTWALAGTTGGLSGTVTDESGAVVAGVAIKAVSASESVSTTTDARGSFSFLNLAPDTYTVSIEKTGYNPISYAGVTIFADQNYALSFKLTKALKEITKVSARAAGSLVKAGTTSDVYSVNQATSKQTATSGGGYNLDNAYSAIANQPGVYQGVGSYNFGQTFYIRGSSYSQVGYEFDGVPVNRAFDNYNSSSLSNLGAAETEVYTGGSPAGGGSATLGGYINQVIKSGTYPGYGDITAAVGAPSFYHKLDVEAGGATPDRLFSWYVGLRGANATPSFINADNGANLNSDGSNAYGFQGYSLNPNYQVYSFLTGVPTNGPWSTCGPNGVAPAGAAQLNPADVPVGAGPNCESYSPLSSLVGAGGFGAYGYQTQDRENILNFHFGIPHHKDGGRDDIQVLFDNYSYHSIGWDNMNTGGTGVPNANAQLNGWAGTTGYANQWSQILGAPGVPSGYGQWNGSAPNLCAYQNFFSYIFGQGNGCTTYANSPGPEPYGDSAYLNGVAFGAPASSAVGKVLPYYFPNTSTNRPVGYGMSNNIQSGAFNDGSIFKLQYTKNIGSNAFLRLFGYTFYSDWLQSNPNDDSNFPVFGFGYNPASPDYEVAYHTRGLQAQFADQINSKNLVTLTANYTGSVGQRANNSQASTVSSNTASAILMNASGQCFSGVANTGSGGRPLDGSYATGAAIGTPVSCLSVLAGAYNPSNNPANGISTASLANVGAGALPASPVAGADWTIAQNVDAYSNINRVSPRFTTAALQDEFRPTDKLDLNLGVRFESYQYVIPNATDAEGQFWANEINQTACVAPTGLVQAPNKDQTPGQSIDPTGSSFGYTSFTTTAPGGVCPNDPLYGQLYHPGTNGIPLLDLPGGATALTKSTFSPRVGATYTLNPDTVLRFTYGRYTQPTETAYEQVLTYADGYQQATKVFGSKYYNNGLNSTIHDNPIQFSNNWDFSLEKHVKGTDLSFKLSPFYRYTTDQAITVALAGGLAGGFNAGTQKSQGVEFQIQKGDPTRNGFSGQVSYTYTDAKIKYSLINGNNYITGLQSTLKTFWNLTKNNSSAAPCYVGGNPLPSCNLSDASTSAALAGINAANGTAYGANNLIANPYYNLLPNTSLKQFLSAYPVDGWYPTYANYFPSSLGGAGDDYGTAIPQNVFSGFLAYKHNKLQTSLNATLQQGTKYGSPTEVLGIDPTSCGQNQAGAGVVAGSQLADYQSCAGQVPIPNPATGSFDGVAQFTNPWIFNLGGEITYDFTPRVSATVSLANLLNRCFGGTKTAWQGAYAPNQAVCSYAQSSGTYLGWTPNEAYNTAGAGYFYGANPKDPANGTAGYPNVFNYPYIPTLAGYPFQAYIQLTIKM